MDPIGSYIIELDFVDAITVGKMEIDEAEDWLPFWRTITIRRPYGVIEIRLAAEIREPLESITESPAR